MFEQIVGQEQIKNLLEKVIKKDQVSHAYLFMGPKGIGKKMMALAFAEILRCTAPVEQRPCGCCKNCKMMAGGQSVDVLRIEPETGSKTIKIKQIRALINEIGEKTFDGSIRVCLIFGAEKMTIEAQNALLKSLEEPAPQNIFLLTSENPEKLLPTIRSRCQVLHLEPLSCEGLAEVLERHGQSGKIRQIIDECDGIAGKALEILNNSDIVKIKNEAFSVICDILKGNPMSVFDFAEKMGKEKTFGEIVLASWIRGFEKLFRTEKTGIVSVSGQWEKMLFLLNTGDAEKILEVLFVLSERFGSNVNARLQWESTLLKIYGLHRES